MILMLLESHCLGRMQKESSMMMVQQCWKLVWRPSKWRVQ